MLILTAIVGTCALSSTCVMAIRGPAIDRPIVVTQHAPLALQPGKGTSYPWGYGTVGRHNPQQFRFFFDTGTCIKLSSP